MQVESNVEFQKIRFLLDKAQNETYGIALCYPNPSSCEISKKGTNKQNFPTISSCVINGLLRQPRVNLGDREESFARSTSVGAEPASFIEATQAEHDRNGAAVSSQIVVLFPNM